MGFLGLLKRYLQNKTGIAQPSEALAQLLKGIELHQVGDFQTSLTASQQALELYRMNVDRAGEGAALGNLGLAYQGLGNYQQALNCHQASLEIAQTLSNKQSEASSLGNLGLVYFQLGDYSAAGKHHAQHLDLAKTLDDAQGIANALGNLGMVFDAIGQYSEAMDYHRQALELKKELGDRQGVASTLGNLGIVQYSIGNYKQALDYHQQHLNISREIADKFGEATALSHIGNTYYLLGQSDNALTYYEQHLAIAQNIGDKFGEGSALSNLGNAYQLLKQYEQALEHYQHALRITQEIQDVQGEGSTYNSLGTTYLFLENLQAATDCFEKAFAISNKIGDLTVKAAALDNLGNVCQALQQYDSAIQAQKQAYQINQEIGDIEGIGTAANNLGNTYCQSGNFAEAESILREGIQTWESLRTELEDLQKVSLIDTQRTAYALLQEALVAQERYHEALEVSEQGRAQAFIELLLSRSIHPIGTETANKLKPTPIQTEQIQQLAQQLRITIVEYSIVQTRYPLMYAWVISPSGDINFQAIDCAPLIENLGVSSLQEMSWKMHEEIGVEGLVRGQSQDNSQVGDTTVTNYPLLQSLHQYLIGPIQQYLPRHPDDLVAIVPQNDLFLIPFNALSDGHGIPLIDQHTLLTVPSIQTLELLLTQSTVHKSPLSNRETTLIVGNPTMPAVSVKLGEAPAPLANLPGAEAEARAIAQLLDVDCVTGKLATKPAIQSQLLTAKRIHLATHALLDDIRQVGMPGAIALAPSDNDIGFLSADEIMEYQMQADFIILSACVTGLGKLTGDGVVGLSRSFLAAGVPRLVVSLWSVSDISSTLLMVKLHHLLNDIQEPQIGYMAQTLRQAQQWLRSLTTEQAVAELHKLQPHIQESFRNRSRVGQAYFNRYLKDMHNRSPYPFANPAYWASFTTVGI